MARIGMQRKLKTAKKDSRPVPSARVLDDEADRQFAATLARGLGLLRCFTAAESELTNKEISARTGLPKPTVSRLTYTLTRLGYLRHLPHTGKYGKYGLGTAVLSIGYPLLANLHVRQIARRPMKELADYARGWVSISLRERLNMVYIETARSPEVLNSKPDIGQSFPIAISALGRAYLAGLPGPERAALINEIKVKDPVMWKNYAPRIEKSLADFAKWGFCLGGDYSPYLQSVAVPMRHRQDGHLLVFNCAAPVSALAPNQLERDLGPRLIEMVRSIEDSLDHE